MQTMYHSFQQCLSALLQPPPAQHQPMQPPPSSPCPHPPPDTWPSATLLCWETSCWHQCAPEAVHSNTCGHTASSATSQERRVLLGGKLPAPCLLHGVGGGGGTQRGVCAAFKEAQLRAEPWPSGDRGRQQNMALSSMLFLFIVMSWRSSWRPRVRLTQAFSS